MRSTPNNYYRISDGRDPLRIGLLLDSRDQVPAFFARIIGDINSSNFAKIEFLVTKKNSSGNSSPGQSQSLALTLRHRLSDARLRKRLLYDLYLRLDARMNPGNDPLALVDCRSLLAGIETIG